MKLSRLHIEIIFRHVSAKTVLDNALFRPIGTIEANLSRIIDDYCLKYGVSEKNYLTEDELKIRGEHLKNETDTFFYTNQLPYFFSYLGIAPLFGRNCLHLHDKTFTVKFNELLRWRQLTHQIGEDLFSSSFLAFQDTLSKNNRREFDWDSNLQTNDQRLESLYEKGISENHSHLLAAGPVFLPSWLSLMNRVLCREKEFNKSKIHDINLSPEMRFWPKDVPVEMHMQTIWAAIIRFYLVQFFKGKEERAGQKELNDLLTECGRALKVMLTQAERTPVELGNLQANIEAFKGIYCDNKRNVSVQLNGETVTVQSKTPVYDYAITDSLKAKNKDVPYIGSGERWIIYSMYKYLLGGDESVKQWQYLFYAYILIKSRFRSELVQVNNKVGFYNFLSYQDRKRKLIASDPTIGDQRLVMAIRGHLANEKNVRFSDARIETEEAKNAVELDELLKTYDKKIYPSNVNLGFPKLKARTKLHRYCIHFLKKEEEKRGEGKIDKFFYSLIPRHSSLRATVKKQAFDIVDLRQNSFKSAERIYAIDAASSEIYARPEVFAHAFRFLKGHYNRESNVARMFKVIGESRKIPALQAKYHVGEEFLDMADGLRAIHEAIIFLNLDRGDALAHLLCLGIDPGQWYTFKYFRIETRKQQYLDTAVWLMAMIEFYSIDVSRHYFNTLENIFNCYFDEIFRFIGVGTQRVRNDEYEAILSSVTWRDYYEAWKLRGDDPELYKTGKFETSRQKRFWDRTAINEFDICADARRVNPKISLLYHLYHYCPHVKDAGTGPIFTKVPAEQAKCVEQIQYHIQKEISQRGIFVETLPSSNVLISSFKRYDAHPILRFYSLNLDSKPVNWPHLHVSINTDDAGIFNTTLKNEFSLMALALSKAKDKDGNSKYSQESIFHWLERVREMGNEQAPK